MGQKRARERGGAKRERGSSALRGTPRRAAIYCPLRVAATSRLRHHMHFFLLREGASDEFMMGRKKGVGGSRAEWWLYVSDSGGSKRGEGAACRAAGIAAQVLCR